MCINKLIYGHIKKTSSKSIFLEAKFLELHVVFNLVQWWCCWCYDDGTKVGFSLFSILSPLFPTIYPEFTHFIFYVCIHAFQKSVPTYITHIYIFCFFLTQCTWTGEPRMQNSEQNMKGREREKRAFNVGKLDLGREA